MNRFVKTVLLALIIVGGLWVLLNQQQIQSSGGLSNFLDQRWNAAVDPNPNQPWVWQSNTGGKNAFTTVQNQVPFGHHPTGNRPNLSPLQLRSASNAAGRFNAHRSKGQNFFPTDTLPGLPPKTTGKIRIASFKMNGDFGTTAPLQTQEMLTHLCRQFDIVAFQEIDAQSVSWLEQIGRNAAAKSAGKIQFRAISDLAKVSPGQPLFVILYNTQTVELDFAQWYSVDDPDELLTREPLVGWFRTRGASPEEAFTFTLANIQLDKHRPDLELAQLGNLFRAIRQDGRGEDDVIITGNFNAGDRGLSAVRNNAGLTWVVYDVATSTDKESQFDNLVFAQTATVEYTGQGGVFDFLSAYNLSLADAEAISTHMPVWAEFSVREGDHRPTARHLIGSRPNDRETDKVAKPPF